MIELKDFSAIESPLVRVQLRGSLAFYCYDASENMDKIEGGKIYLNTLAFDHPYISLFAVINHEYMHKVLHERLDEKTARAYDNISGSGRLDIEFHGGIIYD